MEWDGLNRRRAQRIIYPCLVKIASQDQAGDVFLTHTENIGTGGLCVIVKRELKLFSLVDVEIDLIEQTPHISARAKVVWVVRRKGVEAVKPLFYDVGLEFQNLNEKEKARLEEAIKSFIQKGYKILKPVY